MVLLLFRLILLPRSDTVAWMFVIAAGDDVNDDAHTNRSVIFRATFDDVDNTDDNDEHDEATDDKDSLSSSSEHHNEVKIIPFPLSFNANC